MTTAVPTSQEQSPAITSATYLLLVTLFPILLAALLSMLIKTSVQFEVIGPDTEFAHIRTPENGSRIHRRYTADGTIKQDFSDRHLFLIEQNDDGVYPKSSIRNTAGPWSVTLYSGAPEHNSFDIAVVAVNDEDSDRFRLWLKKGEETGHYPGIRQIPSLHMLSTITTRIGSE